MLQGSSKVCVMYHISLGLGADHREYQISSDFTFLWTLFLSRKSISTEKSKQKCTWDNLTYWMAVQIWRILSSANCLTFSFLEKLYPKKKNHQPFSLSLIQLQKGPSPREGKQKQTFDSQSLLIRESTLLSPPLPALFPDGLTASCTINPVFWYHFTLSRAAPRLRPVVPTVTKEIL